MRYLLPIEILLFAFVLLLVPMFVSASNDTELTVVTPATDAEVTGMVDFFATTENVDDETTLYWAVRSGTCEPDATATVAGNVSGFTNDYEWDDGDFSATVNMTGLTLGEYCFVLNFPTLQLRETRTFELVAEHGEDTTAPVAIIVSPNDGATVKGVVTLKGTVVDENPKTSYFRIEGPENYVRTSKYTDGRTTHWYYWDTRKVSDGRYTIYFEARDEAGNKDGTRTNLGDSVDKIVVMVKNDVTVTPPESKLTNFRQCMKGGWSKWDFRNQGQCIRYMKTGKDSR